MDEKTIVIKVGGSMLSISDEKLFDFEQAKKIAYTLIPFAQKRYKFVLVSGGGFLARKYQGILKENNMPIYDMHYVGMVCCTLNASLLRSAFGDFAEKDVFAMSDFKEPDSKDIKFDKPFLISGAGSPGRSADWNAVYLAKRTGSKIVLSLKDIDGVYTADPRKDPSAKKLDSLNWSEYLNIIGNPVEHIPGAKYPVDPIASRYCNANGISVAVIKADNLANIKAYLNGENFLGTVISPD